MKKWFLFLMCGILAGCAGHGPADRGSVSRPGESPHAETGTIEDRRSAARVNGVEISAGSLLKTESLIRAQNMKAGRESKDEDVRREALERLIVQELIYQRAAEIGIMAEEKEVDLYIEKLRTDAGSDEAYNEFLSRENITETYLRDEARRSIVIQNLYDQEVAAGVVISEDEMRAEYEREKDKFMIAETIVLTDIIFFLDPEESSSVQRAEALLKLLRDEKKEPSELESDGTFVVREITNPQGMDYPLREEARKLQDGEFSGVIKTEGNIHIIKLRKRSPEKLMDFENVKRMIENNLKAEARKKRMEEWKSELKENAGIEILMNGAGEK
jgi:parvulin-like peptidyl-prolyl isomerase